MIDHGTRQKYLRPDTTKCLAGRVSDSAIFRPDSVLEHTDGMIRAPSACGTSPRASGLCETSGHETSPVQRLRAMKIRPNHLMTAMALTLAVFLVLSNASQVAGVVLCVGLDGHVEIETIFDGCCVPGTAGSRGNTDDESVTDSACSDCTDVQLKAPPLRSKGPQSLQPGSDAKCVACSPCSESGIATCAADVTDMDQHSKALTGISTVVLLT